MDIAEANNAKFLDLKNLKLPLGQYAITGSGPMGIRNLRLINDIDIIVSQELWQKLATQYGVTEKNQVKIIAIENKGIEVLGEDSFYRLGKDPNDPSFSERILQAEIIDGLPFELLEHNLYFKRKMGREKDLADIKIIEGWQLQLKIPHWQLFPHSSDMGVRGFGNTLAEAFEQAAMALTAMVTEPTLVQAIKRETVDCEAPDHELLLMDWLNQVIYTMATRHMLFSRFEVQLEDHRIKASLWGESLDIARHSPAVEPKAATFTELKVAQIEQDKQKAWVAQCVIDV